MATTAVFSHQAALCPPPLHIKKKPRRTSFRRRILRKSSHSQSSGDEVYRPLDDIIDEITGDIWRSPVEFTVDPSLFGWPNPLKAAATWAVTPLPVSRIPSDVPLTIRKQRNSRSTASGSSISDAMYPSRDTSHSESTGIGSVTTPSVSPTAPWPSFESALPHRVVEQRPESSETTLCTDQSPAQQHIQSIMQNAEGSAQSTARRPSRLRRLTNVLPRLRRGTSSSNPNSNGTSSNPSSPINAPPASHEETNDGTASHSSSPTGDSFRGWLSNNAHRASTIGMISWQVAEYFPPQEYRHDPSGSSRLISDSNTSPTTMKAVIRIFPEVKVLTTEDHQKFWVAVEVEGMLHNRRDFEDPGIDVVVLVDNAYYVSKDCFIQALDVVVGALNLLSDADRFGLYATHCTHEVVTGIVPDLLYPLRPLNKESKDVLRDMISSIGYHGTQNRNPPRPNPSMVDVIVAVAKSLENRKPRHGRTHIILLSPVASNVHDVSKFYPDLYIHQINPAAVPFYGGQDPDMIVCNEKCCTNAMVHNWAHYQSIPNLMKQVLRYARSEKPFDDVTNVHIDIRTRSGCEVLRYKGSTEIPRLRPGQVHSFFIHISVARSETREMNLETRDPVVQSCLNKNNLRHDLQIASARGASKVHLLSVQVMHQDSLHDSDCWNFVESQLIIIKELGKLAQPTDNTLDLYRRLLFFMMSRLGTEVVMKEIENLHVRWENKEGVKRIIERLQREIDFHEEIVEYEKSSRQKIPSCPGPIYVPPPHEWLIARWNPKMAKK